MTDPELLIDIGGGAEDLLLPQLAGDLARPAASSAHGENPADNGGGFLVHHQLLAVVLVRSVAAGCPGSEPLPTFHFGAEDDPHLAAGVPNIPFVEPMLFGKVFEEGKKTSNHAGLRRDGSQRKRPRNGKQQKPTNCTLLSKMRI